MSADEHLSQPQFFHGTPHQFNPGDVLTREGAWKASHPGIASNPDALRRYKLYSPGGPHEEPAEDHLYYGDHSLLGDMHGMYKGDSGHVYAVEPITPTGRKTTKHQLDPNYKDYGGGAYRTKGQLRVLHEVNEHGERL